VIGDHEEWFVGSSDTQGDVVHLYGRLGRCRGGYPWHDRRAVLSGWHWAIESAEGIDESCQART